jgi:hypothetical protein
MQLEIYDMSSGSWQTGSARPFFGNHHAAEVAGNKLYLFGGLTEGAYAVQIATLRDGDDGVDVSWDTGANLPTPSGSAATALIGGKVCTRGQSGSYKVH